MPSPICSGWGWQGLAGAGSDTDPYQIHNIFGLYLIWENKGAVYRLENDIDASATRASGTLYWNSGKGWLPLACFTGTIDGNNHEVSNLYINRPDQFNVGLIGDMPYVGSPILKNLRLINVNITGAGDTGALVGQSMQSATIENCSVSGMVTGNGINVGGLIGYTQFATISNCSSSAIVTGTAAAGGLVGHIFSTSISRCYASADVVVVSGDHEAGGLIGIASTNSSVVNCYAWGDVSGEICVGGFVGRTSDNVTLSRCYSAGIVTGSDSVGGFMGLDAEATTADCFYDRTVCGLSDNTCGTMPKTTGELQDPDTFSGWDPAIWSIMAGQYPTLMP